MSAATVPVGRCVCGQEFELATPLQNTGTSKTARPEPGSLTLCIRCARAYQFDKDMRHVPVDLGKLNIDADQLREIRRAQRAIVQLRRVPS